MPLTEMKTTRAQTIKILTEHNKTMQSQATMGIL